MASGNGGIPMPDDVPAVSVGLGETVRIISPPDAEILTWRVVGLTSSLWPGPSEEAVVYADAAITDDGPTQAVCFAVSIAGDQMVQVRLDYSHDRGYGNFFWHLMAE